MAYQLPPRQELEIFLMNQMDLLNAFNSSAFQQSSQEPRAVANKVLKEAAEALKDHGYDAPTCKNEQTNPYLFPVEPDRIKIILGQLSNDLGRDYNRQILRLALKTLTYEAGIDFNDVGIISRPRQGMLSKLSEFVFGPQIVVTLPDKRTADMLIAQASLEIRKQEKPIEDNPFKFL